MSPWRIDTAFALGLPDQGLDLVLHAAVDHPALFTVLINDGWPQRLNQPTVTLGQFAARLPDHFEDSFAASQRLYKALSGLSPADVNAALFCFDKPRKMPAACAWFDHAKRDDAWPVDLVRASLAMGMDPSTEFVMGSATMKPARHTLMSSLLAKSITFHWIDSVDRFRPPLAHLIGLGLKPGKVEFGHIMTKGTPGRVKLWLDYFFEQGAARPEDVFEIISKMKVPAENLAILHAMAAKVAMNHAAGAANINSQAIRGLQP